MVVTDGIGQRVWRVAEDGQLGIFAGKPFHAGELVERCYCLPLKPSAIPGMQLQPWLYDRKLGGDEGLLFPFGWGLLYNEVPAGASAGPNVTWEYEESLDANGHPRQYVNLCAAAAIAVDEELCVSRGIDGSSNKLRDMLGRALKVLDEDIPDVTLPEKNDWTGSVVDIKSSVLNCPDAADIEVLCSPLHGNGVYAKRSYEKDDVVEIVPNLLIMREQIGQCLIDYRYFAFEPDNGVAKVALGFGSIYNHDNTPNLRYCSSRTVDCKLAQKYTTCYYATRKIEKGEELFITYGPKWWASRQKDDATQRYDDGGYYKGDIDENTGKRHGAGTYRFPTGAQYEGQWNDGKFHGSGVYRWDSGEVFEGEYVRGVRHGWGRYTHADATVEVNNYVEGQCSGLGFRWSADRATAWRLKDGHVGEEVAVITAKAEATAMGAPTILEF